MILYAFDKALTIAMVSYDAHVMHIASSHVSIPIK